MYIFIYLFSLPMSLFLICQFVCFLLRLPVSQLTVVESFVSSMESSFADVCFSVVFSGHVCLLCLCSRM